MGRLEIITVETPSLGDRSYVVVSDGVAAVVDPQRDIDRMLRVLDERKARLAYVFETHVHNDYVTGGLELARRGDAQYVLSAADEVDYDRVGAVDGQVFEVGGVSIRAANTPGHTPNHMSYVVLAQGGPAAVFTGGSLLYGTVGRTDLISAQATEQLTRDQFRSVRRLAAELPDSVSVHPTHGFGSFCSSASSSGASASTIGNERVTNLALQIADEDAFVEQLLSGLTAYPGYYARMAPLNRRGPAAVDLSEPTRADPQELRRRIDAGEWVVDLRARTAFARGHVAGTVNVELGDSFVTYLGWTLPWGTPVTLLGETSEDVVEAQRQMVRIGIDRPAAAAEGGLDAWADDGAIRSFRSATFSELTEAQSAGRVEVLDVRRDDEWAQGHIDGALHIPLYELEARVGEVPTDAEVWVHCASGYRAAIAASLLDRAGRTVVAIDDDWEKNGVRHGD